MPFEQKFHASADPDMTPMIDVTFQLVIFFMLTLNFAQFDQNERIKLPSSELAKPSASPFKTAIMVQVTDQGTVIMGGDEVQIPAFSAILRREKAAILADKSKSLADATILIRADKFTQTGKIQEVIKTAQENQFEKFVLRARSERRAIGSM